MQRIKAKVDVQIALGHGRAPTADNQLAAFACVGFEKKKR
jgi:hypothetical protein